MLSISINGGVMIITFASIVFVFLLIFQGVRKNTFYILYAFSMIALAYFLENHLNIKVFFFSKKAISLFVASHLILINIFTFIAYGRDKSLAKKGEWRIPEIQLHTLELLGGTIGAFIGQKFFHHKNKKKSFMATFFASIAIQIAVIIYLLKYTNIW